jgi:hypothetical protein
MEFTALNIERSSFSLGESFSNSNYGIIFANHKKIEYHEDHEEIRK